MNDYSINGWDNEYARLARAASQLRTISPQRNTTNNNSSAQQKQDQATSIQTGLNRLDTQLHNLESSMTVSSAEAGRRRGLLDGLRRQLSEITGTDPSITGGIGRQPHNTQSSSASAAALRHQDELIDDLAIGVGRLKTQTHLIHDESKAHVHLLNEMDANVDLANAGLEDETRRAMRLREEKSVWRLHLVIVGLSVLLFLLILMGLS